MRLKAVILSVVAAAVIFIIPNAVSIGLGAPEATVGLSKKPTVVSKEIVKPARVIKKTRKFSGWAKPTIPQVFLIAKTEAKKWGVNESRLLGRINCESSYLWWKQNGQYQGLGQFAEETFNRGMRSIETRRIQVVRKKIIPKYVVQISTYSNGKIQRKKAWKRKQTVITTYKAVIPKNPPRTHGFAQIRLMARAMAGLGSVSDSEWECR